jgi:hypothetical protein
MASKADICNMALRHLGQSKEIANVETERTLEAGACRRFYEMARNGVLRDYDWPFARVQVELGLIEEDPTEEWGYSYRYPVECEKFLRILSGSRNDDEDSRVKFEIRGDAAGRLIYTDVEEAVGEYIERVSSTARFPADFAMALSYRLAALIAPSITAGDPFGLIQRVNALYTLEVSKARANARNEEQQDLPPDDPLTRSRE